MNCRSLSRSLFLVLLSALITPALAFAQPSVSISGIPAVLERNKTYSFTVSATSGIAAGIPTEVSFMPGRAGAMTFSPSSYTFTSSSDTRTVTLTTASSIGGETGVIAIYRGPWGEIATQVHPIWIQGRTRIVLNAGPQGFPVAAGTAGFFQIALDVWAPAPFPVTFDLSASGIAAPGAVIPSPVTIPANYMGSAPQVFFAGPQHGPLTISGVLSGPSAAYFTAPDPVTVTVTRTIALSGLPQDTCCVFANGTATFYAALMGPAPVGVPFDATISYPGVAASVSPSVLNFAAGDFAKPFVVTAGPTVGDIVVKFITASPYVRTVTHTLRVRGKMTTSNLPASVAPGATTAPITVSLTSPAPNAPITVGVLLAPGAPIGTRVNPSALTFGPGETAKTFTVTAGTGPGTIRVNFSGNSTANAYFSFPASFSIPYLNGAPTPTPTGTNITVAPTTPPGTIPVKVTYGEVTVAGTTTQTAVLGPFQPPSGYEDPGVPTYFSVSTTATVQSPVVVCGTYPVNAADDPTELRIFKKIIGGWVDVTSSLDVSTRQLCGEVLSLGDGIFGIFRLNTAPVVGAITGPTAAIAAAASTTFSATFTDPDLLDVHTGVWVENGKPIGDATITKVDGVYTATGNLSFATGGVHKIYLVIKDGGQAAFSPEFEVTVDAAPPVIQTLTASPESLWQPDSKMHDVTLTVAATDDSGVPVCTITGVSAIAQNVKQTAYVVTGPLTLQLKAFPHSVYTITVTCTDAFDRTTTKTVAVAVQKE